MDQKGAEGTAELSALLDIGRAAARDLPFVKLLDGSERGQLVSFWSVAQDDNRTPQDSLTLGYLYAEQALRFARLNTAPLIIHGIMGEIVAKTTNLREDLVASGFLARVATASVHGGVLH